MCQVYMLENICDRILSFEEVGSKSKYWFIHKENAKHYLFKRGRENTGENVAE